MRVLLAAAVLCFLFSGCDSSGCGGAPPEKSSSGESAGMSGGGGHGGGLGEAVSFQGMGQKKEPPPTQAGPAQASQAAAAGSPAAAAAAASAARSSDQSVICGGFPDLAADCLKAPEFDAIKKKCCPDGQVKVCQGIPGGARLIGTGCTAPAK